MSFLDSANEGGRLDVTHLGMWLNIDKARVGDDGQFGRLLLRAMEYDVGEDHGAYVTNLATEEQRSAALSAFTVVAHESRHFHDLLLTPYGAMVMSQHFRQAFSILSSMGSLSACDAIIVPVTRWTELLPVLQRLDPDLRPPTPKVANLIADIRETEDELRRLDEGILFPDARVTATQILEASAFLIQVGEAGRTFAGLNGANFVLQSLAESGSRDRYLGALQYIDERLGPLPLAAVQIILLAALCGDTFNTAPDALRSPADLLRVLVESLAAQPEFPRPEPTVETDHVAEVDLVDGLIQAVFDQLFGGDLLDTMGRTIDQTDANITEWSRRIVGRDNGSLAFQWITNALAVYQQFADVSGRMIANFSMNPSWYLADQYLDVLPYLPRPLMFFWSDHGLPSTPEFRDAFAIHQQIEVPHLEGVTDESDLRRMYGDFAKNAYDDGSSLLSAMVFSLKNNPRLSENAPQFGFEWQDIDLGAWRTYFDSVVPALRLLAYGLNDGLPGGLGIVLQQILSLRGTRIYSPAGLLPEPPRFMRPA